MTDAVVSCDVADDGCAGIRGDGLFRERQRRGASALDHGRDLPERTPGRGSERLRLLAGVVDRALQRLQVQLPLLAARERRSPHLVRSCLHGRVDDGARATEVDHGGDDIRRGVARDGAVLVADRRERDRLGGNLAPAGGPDGVDDLAHLLRVRGDGRARGVGPAVDAHREDGTVRRRRDRRGPDDGDGVAVRRSLDGAGAFRPCHAGKRRGGEQQRGCDGETFHGRSLRGSVSPDLRRRRLLRHSTCPQNRSISSARACRSSLR